MSKITIKNISEHAVVFDTGSRQLTIDAGRVLAITQENWREYLRHNKGAKYLTEVVLHEDVVPSTQITEEKKDIEITPELKKKKKSNE